MPPELPSSTASLHRGRSSLDVASSSSCRGLSDLSSCDSDKPVHAEGVAANSAEAEILAYQHALMCLGALWSLYPLTKLLKYLNRGERIPHALTQRSERIKTTSGTGGRSLEVAFDSRIVT
jgi:hypothetical protein